MKNNEILKIGPIERYFDSEILGLKVKDIIAQS
jgi:hypothetical protein